MGAECEVICLGAAKLQGSLTWDAGADGPGDLGAAESQFVHPTTDWNSAASSATPGEWSEQFGSASVGASG